MYNKLIKDQKNSVMEGLKGKGMAIDGGLMYFCTQRKKICSNICN